MRFVVEGASLVATATREAEDQPYRVLAPQPATPAGMVDVGDLAGKRSRFLRFVVQGEAGAQVTIRGASSTAGAASQDLVLP